MKRKALAAVLSVVMLLTMIPMGVFAAESQVIKPEGAKDITPIQGMVNSDEVNLRQGPGLYYEIVGQAQQGMELIITATMDADGLTWGMFDTGWICMDYVDEKPEGTHETFWDVPASAFYAEPVTWALEQGITTGKTETTFQPNGDCTRAQIVTFLWRANGSPEPKTTDNPFTDVGSGAYYYRAVLWAVENGITNGRTETTFEPNGPCTRAQVVTLMWRESGKPSAGTENNPFTDVASGTYYHEAVLWAVHRGITTGKTATTFQPDATCTRGQIVTFLYRDAHATEQETPETEPTIPETTEPTIPETESTTPSEPQQPGEYNMAASNEIVQMLKDMEGFSATPYWDYTQWTVGYGTQCPADKLDEYLSVGITEEAAEALLRDYIAQFGKALNSFAKKHQITLNQGQFDALVLFCYNCGNGWMYHEDYLITQAVITGATGNDLIRPLSLWCSAGDSVLTPLIERRLIEANMYLNGIYAEESPSNYGYVLLDGNRGTVEHRMQGFDADQPCDIMETPICEGYEFAGWYTERVGGTKITKLDYSVKDRTLYAQWKDPKTGQIVQPQINIPSGTTIDPLDVTVIDDGVNLREGPGTNYSKVGEANTGDSFTITAIYEGSTYTWGKFDGGWIALSFTDYDNPGSGSTESTQPTDPEPTEPDGITQIDPVEVVVTETGVNLRKEPSTAGGLVGKTIIGQIMTISATTQADGYTWGKYDGGWICMDYVVQIKKIDPVEVTVLEADLNLRESPTLYCNTVGNAALGQKFTVSATVEMDGLLWGRYDGGWLALKFTDYKN